MQQAYAQVSGVSLRAFSTNPPEDTIVELKLVADWQILALDGASKETPALEIYPVPEHPRQWKQVIMDEIVQRSLPEFKVTYVLFPDAEAEKP